MGPILCIMGTKKIKFTYLGDKFTYPKAKKVTFLRTKACESRSDYLAFVAEGVGFLGILK
jgi:hypothetical protein